MTELADHDIAPAARGQPEPVHARRDEHVGDRARPGVGGRSGAGAGGAPRRDRRRGRSAAAARAGSRSRTTMRTTPRAWRRCASGSAARRSRPRGTPATSRSPTATRSGRCARSRSRATPTTTSRSSRTAPRSPATPCWARAACSSRTGSGEYLAALERLRALGLALLCPGHGPPVWDPEAKLDEYLAHRADRERRLLAALDAGARTEDELLDAAWADAPAALRPAAALTLRAHLGKLREEGRLPGRRAASLSRPMPRTVRVYDEYAFGFSWVLEEGMQRTSHALRRRREGLARRPGRLRRGARPRAPASGRSPACCSCWTATTATARRSPSASACRT